jgi:hypothetical protein
VEKRGAEPIIQETAIIFVKAGVKSVAGSALSQAPGHKKGGKK